MKQLFKWMSAVMVGVLLSSTPFAQMKHSDYSPQIKESFLSGCILDPELTNYCHCIINDLPNHLSEKAFGRASEALMRGEMTAETEGVAKSISRCLPEVPETLMQPQ